MEYTVHFIDKEGEGILYGSTQFFGELLRYITFIMCHVLKYGRAEDQRRLVLSENSGTRAISTSSYNPLRNAAVHVHCTRNYPKTTRYTYFHPLPK